MFFELATGSVINLNHVTAIPPIGKGCAEADIVMGDKVIHISEEDAQEIRDICLTEYEELI